MSCLKSDNYLSLRIQLKIFTVTKHAVQLIFLKDVIIFFFIVSFFIESRVKVILKEKSDKGRKTILI